MTDADKSKEEDLQEQKQKARTLFSLYSNICQAVIQHVMVVQADQALFLKATGGDLLECGSAMAATTSFVSAIGIFINQIGGKLSDSYGRRPMFALGPIVNIITGLLVYMKPSNLRVLMACRVAKIIGTTMSGTVITSAALTETVQGLELAAAGTKMQSYVGIAIVLGPFIESAILKTTGSYPACYLGVAASSAIQLISGMAMIPETLKNPRPFDLQATLSALNPFGAIKIFLSENRTLKKLVAIWMVIMAAEGKNTSDIAVLWLKDDVKASPDWIRNFYAWYGGVNTLSGLYVNPFFLKRMTPLGFTMLALGCTFSGFTTWGLSMSLPAIFAGTIPHFCGINGSAASAIVPIMKRMAIAEGFGIGEFEAWRSNLRAIPSLLQPLFCMVVYSWLKKHGKYSTSLVFLFHGIITAALPAALLQLTIDKDKLVL